jgi:hypothetical protein
MTKKLNLLTAFLGAGTIVVAFTAIPGASAATGDSTTLSDNADQVAGDAGVPRTGSNAGSGKGSGLGSGLGSGSGNVPAPGPGSGTGSGKTPTPNPKVPSPTPVAPH